MLCNGVWLWLSLPRAHNFRRTAEKRPYMPEIIAKSGFSTWSKFWNCCTSYKFWVHLVCGCMKHLEYWDTENISPQKAFVWLSWHKPQYICTHSPPPGHVRPILAGVLCCYYHPKTESFPPAVMPATVSALGDLYLCPLTILWPVGWMDFFYLESKNRSLSLLQVLTNSAFVSTKEGFADVAALAECNPHKFTSYQEGFFVCTA